MSEEGEELKVLFPVTGAILWKASHARNTAGPLKNSAKYKF